MNTSIFVIFVNDTPVLASATEADAKRLVDEKQSNSHSISDGIWSWREVPVYRPGYRPSGWDREVSSED